MLFRKGFLKKIQETFVLQFVLGLPNITSLPRLGSYFVIFGSKNISTRRYSWRTYGNGTYTKMFEKVEV